MGLPCVRGHWRGAGQGAILSSCVRANILVPFHNIDDKLQYSQGLLTPRLVWAECVRAANRCCAPHTGSKGKFIISGYR